MADVLTPEQRRRNMSRIRGRDTKPEMILRRALWNNGYRYRLHYELLGTPDITFVSRKVVIFVDGCFWHGCPIHAVKPKTNAKFWATKLRKNRTRDLKVTQQLIEKGWTVLRFWEHEVEADLVAVIATVERALR